MDRPHITYAGRDSIEFGLIITGIKRTKGQKKRVTATVPYSSKTYDFSVLDGRYSYGERTDVYEFTLKAANTRELEDRIGAISSWLLNSPPGELRDSCFADRYLTESVCESATVKYLNARYATVSVSFKSYPFMIKDFTHPAFYTAAAAASEKSYELTFADNSIPSFSSTAACSVLFGGEWYSIPANARRIQITDIKFTRGVNNFSLMGSGELTVECFEEVL